MMSFFFSLAFHQRRYQCEKTMSTRTSLIFLFVIQLILAEDPCRYQTSKGLIDLTSVGRNDGTAAYQDQLPATGSSYSMCSINGENY